MWRGFFGYGVRSASGSTVTGRSLGVVFGLARGIFSLVVVERIYGRHSRDTSAFLAVV